MSDTGNEPHAIIARCWRSAARLVAGLSIALVMVAAAVGELGDGHPDWMLPAAGWGLVMAAVLAVESALARP